MRRFTVVAALATAMALVGAGTMMGQRTDRPAGTGGKKGGRPDGATKGKKGGPPPDGAPNGGQRPGGRPQRP
jgi:hypothetical protein